MITRKLFIPVNIKGMSMSLMGVSSISSYKTIIGTYESILTLVICKIKSLEVVNKNKWFNIHYAAQVSTFICALSRNKYFSGGMSHHFSCMSMHVSFAITSCVGLIVITLYPKCECSSSMNHFLIYSSILGIIFHIAEILPELPTAASDDYVK